MLNKNEDRFRYFYLPSQSFNSNNFNESKSSRKGCASPQPQYKHVVLGEDKGKHHQYHTKEEHDDGFQPLTKRKNLEFKKNQKSIETSK